MNYPIFVPLTWNWSRARDRKSLQGSFKFYAVIQHFQTCFFVSFWFQVKYVFGWVGDRKLQITSPGAQGDTLLDIIDITQSKLRRPGIPYVDRIIYTTSKSSGK